MQTTVRLRTTQAMHADLKAASKKRKQSLSALIRSAMAPYLDGKRHLPVVEPIDKQSSFVCCAKDFEAFREMVKGSNLGVDEALRLILKEHIDDQPL